MSENRGGDPEPSEESDRAGPARPGEPGSRSGVAVTSGRDNFPLVMLVDALGSDAREIEGRD